MNGVTFLFMQFFFRARKKRRSVTPMAFSPEILIRPIAPEPAAVDNAIIVPSLNMTKVYG